jgi:hypothetical protein
MKKTSEPKKQSNKLMAIHMHALIDAVWVVSLFSAATVA